MTDLWEEHFTNLQKYHQEHGDCMVGQNFITGDGHPLGAWVQSQRSKHSDDDGGLSAERAAKLDSLGFVWDSLDAAWNEGFEQLKLYQAGRGDCHVPRSFQTKDGHKLGLWVTVQRQRKRIDGWILESRMRKLEDIGFSWVVSDALWEEGFGHLQKYHADVGHCDVPQRFKVDGYPLGSWVQAQRPKKKGAQGGLKEDQFQRLEGLGFLWETREKGWEEGLQLLKIYNAEKGNVRVPGRYAIEGFNLGSWLHNLRSRKVEGKLSEDRSLALEGLGVTW
ncbi:helicase associated domain-containing protein, partial [Pelagophyceae sp. CCMP2097]